MEAAPHPPALPACLCQGRGRGLAPRSPNADAVRNIGFNELQNEAAAADMYGWCPHPLQHPHTHPCPLSIASQCPRRIFQTLGSAFSGKHPSDFQTCSWPHRAANKPCGPTFPPRLHRWPAGGLALRTPTSPPPWEPGQHSPPAGTLEGCSVRCRGPAPTGVRALCVSPPQRPRSRSSSWWCPSPLMQTSRPRQAEERELGAECAGSRSPPACRAAAVPRTRWAPGRGAGGGCPGWPPYHWAAPPLHPFRSLGTRTQLWPCRPRRTVRGNSFCIDCDAPSECWGGGTRLALSGSGELEGGGAPSSPLLAQIQTWASLNLARSCASSAPGRTGIWELTFPRVRLTDLGRLAT